MSTKYDDKIAEIIRQYPTPESAVMPALSLAQEAFGWISSEAINWVSEKTGIAPIHVMEVATFYTMYYKQPVGRYHIQVCRTASCMLRGSKKIVECLKKRLGLKPGEVSADGLWSYEEVECLGSCGTAPVAEINDHYFENLTEEKIEAIINRIEGEKPDLSFSTMDDELGAGLPGYPKSEL